MKKKISPNGGAVPPSASSISGGGPTGQARPLNALRASWQAQGGERDRGEEGHDVRRGTDRQIAGRRRASLHGSDRPPRGRGGGLPRAASGAGKALQADIDDSVWDNSIDSLTWGAANPEIRAGVLRLLSTLPEVTVVKSTTGGQPTLTLTAGPALLEGGRQVLTINAKTGMPISSVVTLPQVPTSVETYQVSRVTLAGVKAGKF
jgi:hypothetical protein